MINTVNIKSEQLDNTYLKTGCGAENILIMGSCRVAPYVNFFNEWNNANGNKFTIYSLDPFNNNWNAKDERTDYNQALLKLETDERLLNMFKSIDVFVHEYYQNSGMFNVKKGDGKTIYDFGISPKIDVCIPSWNDVFVLFKDIVSFDLDIRKKAIQDINVIGKLSWQTQSEIYNISRKGLRKFSDVCLLSDIPEMDKYFIENFNKKRMWHSYNHVAKPFTEFIFNILCDRYLGIKLNGSFYDDKEDMFANSFTPLTEYDIEWYGYEWGEEIKSIL